MFVPTQRSRPLGQVIFAIDITEGDTIVFPEREGAPLLIERVALWHGDVTVRGQHDVHHTVPVHHRVVRITK
jgi:hypothetical protein